MTKWTRNAPITSVFPQNTAVNGDKAAWPDVSTYYTRVTWRDLEASSGGVSGGFPANNPLETRIAAAAARGQRTIFRVMAVDTDSTDTDVRSYPDYLTGSVAEWQYHYSDGVNPRTLWVPDWNDPDYLAAAKRLINQLGAKYDGDPRVAGFDIFGYGTWGEWNASVWGGSIPAGFSDITQSSAQTLINANVAAFPRTQLFSFTDPKILPVAMAASSKIGVRFDCLGSPDGGGAFAYMAQVPASLTRWKTAPVASEYCSSGAALYANAAKQVRDYHVSLVSSGNFPASWSSAPMSSSDYQSFSTAAKIAGPRIAVNSVTSPASATRGSQITVGTQWINFGSAPLYAKPNVYLELRPSGTTSNAVVQQSAADLSGFASDAPPPEGTPESHPGGVPGAEVHPVLAYRSASDQFTIPSSLPVGTYDLAVIAWPTYSKSVSGVPGLGAGIRLAQGNQASDGHYVIAQIKIT